MGEFNQAKYIQKYQKENYDRCIFNVPKGEKKKIIEHYEKAGYESMNQYVNALIKRDMQQNGGALNRWENRAGVSIFLRIAKGTSILRAPLAKTPFGRLRGRAP